MLETDGAAVAVEVAVPVPCVAEGVAVGETLPAGCGVFEAPGFGVPLATGEGDRVADGDGDFAGEGDGVGEMSASVDSGGTGGGGTYAGIFGRSDTAAATVTLLW